MHLVAAILYSKHAFAQVWTEHSVSIAPIQIRASGKDRFSWTDSRMNGESRLSMVLRHDIELMILPRWTVQASRRVSHRRVCGAVGVKIKTPPVPIKSSILASSGSLQCPLNPLKRQASGRRYLSGDVYFWLTERGASRGAHETDWRSLQFALTIILCG